MILIQNLNLLFGDQIIFNNLNLTLNGNEKIGLVGLNGSGKSTLLKIIGKKHEFDSGKVIISEKKRIGYIPQEVSISSTLPVIEEIIANIEISDETETPAITAEAKKILMGLGFSQDQITTPVNNLSVGWRMRMIIAQLLLQKADFYLFDEPTNHLDIVTKKWFFDFLKNAKFGFLLVCHEKYFLNNLCDSIFELENGTSTLYKGNYDSYIIQKESASERLEKAYMQQQRDIAHKEELIAKFKAKASKAGFAKSLEKKLEKMEKIELKSQNKNVEFKLPEIKSAGRIVLTINQIGHSFDTKKIFENINLEIERCDKVALVAANGVGKTTLLNIIVNKINKQSGHINIGHNVTTSFFEQDQVRALNPEKTIFETLQENCNKVTDQDIRTMLGCFLFSQDLIHKKTKVLSGGERNRVSMARVLLQDTNFLIPDEPTNHLDIPSKELLLHALQKYKGTILLVSHDRDFINNLATHIIELTPNGAFKYKGNFDEYITQKEFAEKQNLKHNNKHEIKTELPKINPNRKNVVYKLEQQIEKLEAKIHSSSLLIAQLKWGTDEFIKMNNDIKELQKKLDQLIKEWENILTEN